MGGSVSQSSLISIITCMNETDAPTDKDFVIFRYIDDILVTKSKDTSAIHKFDSEFKTENKLQIIRDNRASDKKVNYLDVSIANEGNNMITCIYDKKNDFDFNTIKFFHFSSNVHISIF